MDEADNVGRRSKAVLDQEANSDLIARARHDRAAFASLYDLYLPRVYAYCLLHCRHRHVAEDLTALTFERALRAIATYDARGVPLSHWLLKIASNVIIDDARRSSRVTLVSDDARGAMPSLALGPDQLVEMWEQAEWLQRHLHALSPDHQFVLRLHYFDGLPMQEVARRMARSDAATRQLLHRAIVALRTRIASDEDGDEHDRSRSSTPSRAGARVEQ